MTTNRSTPQRTAGHHPRRRHPRNGLARGSEGIDRCPDTTDKDILTTRVGLRIPAALTFERWQHAGSQISRIVDSSAWCLGDWLVYGQREYSDRYLRAIEESRLDYQTLRNYAWVARKFPIERRRETLSFQHHAEVGSLPPEEQDRWLDLADEFGWSRNELRRNIRTHRQQDAKGGTLMEPLPKLSVTAERVQRWRQAAELSADNFEHWMLRALDDAAAADLHGRV
ncbi:LmbU family transcriptional regulator [Micromonospora sp. WMMD735]|uniref:LmbU family transcriptional regulator n=1 Tax=Micromonospora sp. WMMD735 TaxID=3404130 RepID=UPI003B93DB48